MNDKDLEQINSNMLLVLDFSAIVNIKSKDVLNELSTCFLNNKTRVAISREFYENYDVVIKTLNNDQKSIASMAYEFLKALKKSNSLLYMSDILSTTEIVKKLHKNPNVCFVYYKNSEFAENVLNFRNSIECKAIIVDENGDYRICSDVDIIKSTERKIDSSAEESDYYKTSFIPAEGKRIKTRDNTKLELGRLIGNGGEGMVYDCSSKPGYVIKIYRKEQLTKLRLKKIFFMEKKQIRYDGLCWPEQVVFSENNEPIGYLMKKIEGKPLDTVFDGDECLLSEFPMWTKTDVINLAIDILQKIQYLHMFGILIGDLRLKNIVVDRNGNACLVDLDSCQIDNLPCPTGFSDYTPPELQQIELKSQLRSFWNESFSCSVLLFKILFYGLHPYDQKNGADTLEEEIRAKSFPYPLMLNGDFSRIPWGGYKDVWRYTPVQMQRFLFDIFKENNRYSVQEMIMMLKTYCQFINLKKTEVPEINKISF